MPNSEIVFIFTKDRPEKLGKTLNSIQGTHFTKYVIDDSALQYNQKSTLQLCNAQPNITYLGKEQFHEFTLKHQIDFPKFDFLLRTLGREEWNLGYARNFALLYAKSLRTEKVLFTDDDIKVPNPKLIEELFLKISNYQFVGANILGLADDSVLGHIATDVGIINERMLSGGFMAFNPNKIDHFFLNNYNEDWIWLFLQLKSAKYLQTGEVFQEITDPLANYQSKILFQEFGEIALDGILDLFKSGSYDSLAHISFWERLVNERKDYLDLLIASAVASEKKNYVDIIEWIKSNSKDLSAAVFKGLFEKYFRDRILFKSVYNSLP